MAVIERLGDWDTSDTLLQTAVAGQDLIYEPALGSGRLWKVVVEGAGGAVSVRVNENLVYQCALWNKCSNITVNLQGTRGRVHASSSSGVVKLYVFKRRAVVLRTGLYMTLSSDAVSQVQAWAAQGRLRAGDVVFKDKNVFTEDACSFCPRGLLCKEPTSV
jgi:hypothetical protein